jgi:hypothetical protein
MLRRFFVFSCVLSLGLLAASSSSHAQTLTKESNQVKAKVAFAFQLGDKVYPAGSYQVLRRYPITTNLVIIDEKGEETPLPVIALLAEHEHATHKTSGNLVFNRVGDERFLSEVWLPGEDGYLIYGSAQPHQHEIVKTEE